ncbi:MAG TPA: class II aldolase/adducin family protein [Alphaproteobacteria bacterium]
MNEAVPKPKARTAETPQLAALKHDLLCAFHVLDRAGQGSGVAGHLTARLPGAQTFWSHKWGMAFEEVTLADLQEADFELNVVTGTEPINPTLHIHTRIYLARPDVTCIIHTHGKHVIALSALGCNLEPVTQTGAMFYEDCALFDEYDGIVLGKAEGDAIAEAIGTKRAVLLKHHGLICVDNRIGQAVIGALTLELAAEMQLLAMAAGTPHHLPREAALQAKAFLDSDETSRLRWAYLKRKVMRERPDKIPPAPPA